MMATRLAPLRVRVFLSMQRLGLIWLLTGFSWGVTLTPAVEGTTQTPRLTVAVLTFAVQTDDPEAGHWRYTIPRLLGEQSPENDFPQFRLPPVEAEGGRSD
jgi:hypothetical protein